jgi:hypothetical protein
VVVDPEREMIRRARPFFIPALLVASIVAFVVAGIDASWSAALGVLVVSVNFVVHGRSLAWAARVSPTVLFAVGMGGFVLRLAGIFLATMGLRQFPWFSSYSFILAVIPSTVALLVFELTQLGGRLQVEMWNFDGKRI